MKRLLAVMIALSLLLAGCLGTPVSTGDTGPETIEPDEIPGVSNGTVSNASALSTANYDGLAETGADLRTVREMDDNSIETRLRFNWEFSSFNMTRTATADRRLDVWGNESTQTLRVLAGSETNYRVTERQDERFQTLNRLDWMLDRGAFSLNRTTSNGTAVFSASAIDSDAESGAGQPISSSEGTLVVRESGVIERLDVHLVQDEQTTDYRYNLVETGVDSVERPDWLGDVPPTASLHPEISIDVVNETHLRLENEGDDRVPADTTLSMTMNDSDFEATFTEPLESGDHRFVYLDASGNGLRISDQEPGPEYAKLYSPISLSLTTESGVSLYSASFGWDSASGGAGGSTSSGSSSA